VDLPPGQAALLTAAETEAIRPGHTGPWNPAAARAYLTGTGGAWHAMPRRWAEPAITRAARTCSPPMALAACGQLAQVVPEHGTYDRMRRPVAAHPCRTCAWQLAIETGSTGRELALITPGLRTADALARAGADPMLASSICQAILAAESSDSCEYGLDHPATVQLLAHATVHRPVLLVDEECAAGECGGHHPDGDPDAPAQPCDYPDPAAACGACSLAAGPWAGEWEDDPLPECTVTAPCSVLTTLARHYRVPPSA
jgi:hypothetical protein